MSDFKILIDTNVFIGLEDAAEVSSKFSDLMRKCSENGIRVFVHNGSVADIERDPDISRRAVSLSKIRKFEQLSATRLPDRATLEAAFGRIRSQNDEVDVSLIHAVHVGAVDFLVTEDRRIHSRVRDTALGKRILNVDDSLVWLRQTFEPTEIRLPLIFECKAHEVDQSDELFESLRDGYPDFDRWWKEKCVKSHRLCWAVTIDGELAGLVVRKDETHDEAKTEFTGKKILKICTFKVKPKFRGEKLGELFLKQILWFAQKNNYDLVYLTTFDDQPVLIQILEYFGFVKTKKKDDGELFYEKPISRGRLAAISSEDLYELCRVNYPRFVCGPPAKIFYVPIRDEYHRKLFPELAVLNPLPLFPGRSDFVAVGSNRAPGNTIRKVYLCRAQTTEVSRGDCLLFYRSRSPGFASSQSITSVGVVEAVTSTSEYQELVRLTAKRSVFSESELERLIGDGSSPIKVIDFLLTGHIDPPIGIDELLRHGALVGGPPQSISRLPSERFQTIKNGIKLGFDL